MALGALCDAMTEVPRRRARDLHDGVVGQEGGGDIGERGGGDDKDNSCSRHLFHDLLGCVSAGGWHMSVREKTGRKTWRTFVEK